MPEEYDRLMQDLLIVIVSYNTRDLLEDCLRSVYRSAGDFEYTVCVVDNNSADGSAEMVRTRFPQAHLIESDVNGGYAYANNLALRAYGFRDDSGSVAGDGESAGTPAPRYVLLLNPDTVLPATALRDMVAFMDSHSDTAIVGPKLVRQDGSLDMACRRSFPSPAVSFYRLSGLSKLFPRHPRFGRYNLTYLDPDVVTEVDSVVGAFMLVRGKAIQQAGILDERFFMYGEDIDWAYRIKQFGWHAFYYPRVQVLHYKGESSKQRSMAATIEFYRAMKLFYVKHYRSRTFFLLNWLIEGGIWLLLGWAMLRNALRPRDRRSVASATL